MAITKIDDELRHNKTTHSLEVYDGGNWQSLVTTATNNGVNTGDETTISIQTKRPLKTIEGQSLEGSGNIDLTKSDVGLSNVDNTSDLNKPISTATQTALDLKSSILTLQSINVTSNVTNWNSIVEIGNTPLTANIIITLPTCVGNIGKSIIFKRIDNTAFTVTVQAFAGQSVEITTNNFNIQFGATTITCVSGTKSEQTSNNNPSARQVNLLAQIATIGTTTIFITPQAGLYQVQIIGSVGTAGNRNVTAQNIIHTEAGIVRTKTVGAGVNTNNANNGNTITQVFQCDANTNIQYNNTMSGTTGNYNIRILITKLN